MRRWTAALEAAQITVKQSGFRATFWEGDQVSRNGADNKRKEPVEGRC